MKKLSKKVIAFALAVVISDSRCSGTTGKR